MKTERAIEILDPEHREHYESIEPVNEACRMGMAALKKQVPLHPHYGDSEEQGGNEVFQYAYCPCGRKFIHGLWSWGSKHCPDCGQALDWSEE